LKNRTKRLLLLVLADKSGVWPERWDLLDRSVDAVHDRRISLPQKDVDFVHTTGLMV
jgi:hypothetical protein